jgi:exopolysaccharide biosynthesis polyprenyl glycosylphosphotransferase
MWLPRLLADLVALTGAYYCTLLIRFHTSWGGRLFVSLQPVFGGGRADREAGTYEAFYLAGAFRIIVQTGIVVFTLYALRDLYSERRFVLRRPVGWNIVTANVVALVIFYTYFYLRRNVFHPRSFFASMIAFNAFYAILLRGGVDWLLGRWRSRHADARCRALVLGHSEEGDALCGYINLVHPHGIWTEGRLVREAGEPIAAFHARVREIVRRDGIELLLSVDKSLNVAEIMRLLELADELGVATKVLTDRLDVLIIEAKIPADMVQGVPLLHFPPPVSRARTVSKSCWSIAVAAGALVLTLPLQALIAALIKLTSSGPVLFVQERIGVNRRAFRMMKFRTMYDRAEESQAQVEEFNESGPGLFKMRRDPRITPAGRLLRRFSLDELPQLYNVLRGEMTIVGPRPLPRRDFENYYEQWHYGRHAGMPGLTCLWQVSGRSNIDFHNMCILDVYYLRNQNWVLDLRIVLKTIWAVLFAKGAY